MSNAINFRIDTKKCIQCGLCAQDCPMLIINPKTEFPAIKEGKEKNCIKCQHCLAICPTGALSIWNLQPENSMPVTGNFPQPEQMANLIKTRRSIRKFKYEELDKEVIQELLEAAIYAPTGHNINSVLFSVVDNKEDFKRLRELTYEGIRRAHEEDRLALNRKFMFDFQRLWVAKQVDVLFRNTPHLIVASVPKTVTTPEADTNIALCYFELYANTHNIGTLWNGMVKWAINEIAPELRKQIGIPDDHIIGNVMSFGKPGVKYARSVQIMGEHINRIRL